MNRYLVKIAGAVNAGVKAISQSSKGTVISRASVKAPKIVATAPDASQKTTKDLAHMDLSPPPMANIPEKPIAANTIAANNGVKSHSAGMLTELVKSRI